MSADIPMFDADEIFPEADEEETPKARPVRMIVKAAATHSVRFVVSSAITAAVPVESKWDKRRVFIGSYVISGIINERVKNYIDNEIDEQLEFVRDVRAYIKKLSDDENS